MRKRALEMLKNHVFGGDNIWYNRPRNDAAWCQFCCAIHCGNIAIHKAWSLSNFTGNFFFIFYISTSISCSQAFSLRKWTVCIKYTQVYTYDTHECMQCKQFLHTVVSSIFLRGYSDSFERMLTFMPNIWGVWRRFILCFGFKKSYQKSLNKIFAS